VKSGVDPKGPDTVYVPNTQPTGRVDGGKKFAAFKERGRR